MAFDFHSVTAHKKHTCVHCREPILVGEKHQKFVGKWEGDLQSWRVHEDCQEALMRCQDDFGSLCNERHQRGLDCRQMEGHV